MAIALNHLPVEILDEIAVHIDSYADILATALCCKTLSSVLIPAHLRYRHICAKLSASQLWTRLARSDDLHAAHIHSLTILPQWDSDIWSWYSDDLPIMEERLPFDIPETPSPSRYYSNLEFLRECETNLISALRRMSNLRQFRWFRVPQPVVDDEHDIWNTLKQLGTVKEIHVLDAAEHDRHPKISHIILSRSFLNLRGLTSLAIRTSAFDSTSDGIDVAFLSDLLLINCPAMESLSIHMDLFAQIETANIDWLLDEVIWLHLHTLRLHGFNCHASSLIRFLTLHPTLKSLSLPPMMPGHAWPEVDLPDGTLPNLCHLECPAFIAAALLKNPRSLPRLKSLEGVELYDTIKLDDYFSWDDDWDVENDDIDTSVDIPSPWKSSFLGCLRAHTSITSIMLFDMTSLSDVEALSAAAPQLKKFGMVDGEAHGLDTEEFHEKLHYHFPELEIIQWSGLLAFHNYKDCKDRNDQRMRWLVKIHPRLRIVQTWWAKVVIVERGENIKWVARYRSSNEESVALEGEEIYITDL